MRVTLLLGTVTAVVLSACADNRVAAPAAQGGAARSASPIASAGMEKTAIGGTMQIFGITAPERTITTPSDFCQRFGIREFTNVSGDITGPVTFEADAKGTCDYTHLRSSGPVSGQVTFQDVGRHRRPLGNELHDRPDGRRAVLRRHTQLSRNGWARRRAVPPEVGTGLVAVLVYRNGIHGLDVAQRSDEEAGRGLPPRTRATWEGYRAMDERRAIKTLLTV